MQDLRIVSLVPSATLTACDLGLRPAIVGCTNFCVKPRGIYKSAVVIGGTKDPDIAKIRSLNPSHILVNEEENRAEDIAACASLAKVVLSFPRVIADSSAYIAQLANLFGRGVEAKLWSQRYESGMDEIALWQSKGPFYGQRFLYLIWKNPYMAAASNTYVSEACRLLGMENVLPAQQNRYPELTRNSIEALRADVILFSSEPYPFRRRDLTEFWEGYADVSTRPTCYKIDGQLCSWWGSMTIDLLDQTVLALQEKNNFLIKRL